MSSKENILNRIKKAGSLTETGFPDLGVEEQPVRLDKIEMFMNALKEAGGSVIIYNPTFDLRTLIPENAVFIENNGSRLTDHEIKKIAEGDQPVTAMFGSSLAVAENGAVWLCDDHLAHRALPFVAEQVIILVQEDNIVWDMHQAYERIGWDFGFGVFVSGPSKTADIEQNLVIGAHGPSEFIVVINNGS